MQTPPAKSTHTQRAVDIASGLQEKAKKRKAARQADYSLALEDMPAPQLMLPLFSIDERGMPNALARGAIFNANKSGEAVKRIFHENRLVASLSNMRVEYQGQELRQDDCSVFMALLHFQQETLLGEPVEFTAYGMLKELGWTINKAEYQHLRDCCTRLAATALSISFNDGTQGFTGSLLRSFAWKDDTNTRMSRWVARFETSIARFFQEDSYSIIDPKIRRKLSGRAPLAQWLHNFFSTHREPFAMSVTKYHQLTDSRAKDISDFRDRMKIALGRLVEHGFLISWEIQNDIVYVTRTRFARAAPKYRSLPLEDDCIEMAPSTKKSA
jgi:hypothetical protein